MQIIIKRDSKLGVGDLIQFNDNATGLIIEGEQEKKRTEEGFSCLLLTDPDGDDWLQLADGYIKEIDRGEYKILAQKETWDIVAN